MAGFGAPPSSLCCGSLWAVLVCFSCFNGVLRGSSGVLWATLGPMGSGLAPDSLAVRRRVNCIFVCSFLVFTREMKGRPLLYDRKSSFRFRVATRTILFVSPVTFLFISCFSGCCPGAPTPGKGVKK